MKTREEIIEEVFRERFGNEGNKKRKWDEESVRFFFKKDIQKALTIQNQNFQEKLKELEEKLKEERKKKNGSLLSSILLWFLSDNIKVDEERLKRLFISYSQGEEISKTFKEVLGEGK